MTVDLALPDLELGDHVCAPFSSAEQQLTDTTGFTEHALRCGGRVVVCTESVTPEAMREWLRARVPGLAGAAAAGAVEDGRLNVLASREVYLEGDVFDPDRVMDWYAAEIEYAEREGYAGLWAIVDMAWSRREVPGAELLLDYETDANPGFTERRAAAVCQYDRRLFSAQQVERASRAHPITLGQAPLRFFTTADPAALVLTGEVDLSNCDALAAILKTLALADGEVTIDATGLAFADVRGAHLLAAAGADRSGHTTIACSGCLAHLLHIIGAGTLAGVTVRETAV
ncbi:MAG: MEDS domain-containing protein [Carbonactinosporaceae bacterium]